MDSDNIRERLKQYKYDTDDTYKNVAIACNIPFSTFYGFSAGTRTLKEKFAKSLDSFLKSKGY